MAGDDHQFGFQTLDEEVSDVPLTIEGSFPQWLAGSLLRTGPARFEVGSSRYRHWFDGLAMLHRFAFAGGAVSYSNRYLDSPAHQAARSTGRITYAEFATDPCRSLFRRVVTTFRPRPNGANANVNVLRFGDDFVALTESPLPVVFDPATLRTLGVAAPAPGQLTVAHPHLAPRTGELVSYATHFGPSSEYRLYVRGKDGAEPAVLGSVKARRPSYMHSFAVTERHAVLVEFPFVVVPPAIPLSGRPLIENFRWKPERGTRFQVLDLETGQLRGAYRGEPFFAFHHVNAFERDNTLVVDVCAYDDPEIVKALYLERLRRPDASVPGATLRRYTVPLDGGTVRSEQLSHVGIELPRIDYERHNGRPYRYVYGVGGEREGDFPNRLVKVDVEDRESAMWTQAGTYPGEPVFVRRPGGDDGEQEDDGEREDGGVLLSVVLDPAAGASFLLVLDATDLTEAARAWVPHGIPFGFHGSYFS
jgi:beta,beta-carotene 9',10'-dioxygenase